MSFSIKYSPLCVIDLYHDFHLNKSSKKFIDMIEGERKARITEVDFRFEDFFDIQPSSETQQILEGQKILIRKIGSSLTVLIRVDSSDNELPFVRWQQNKPLRFLIKLKDALFFNYSNLAQPSGQIYLFTNRNVIPNFTLDPIDEGAVVDNQAALKLMPLSNSNDYVDSSFLLNPINSRRYYKILSKQEQTGVFGIIELHPIAASANLSLMNHSTPSQLKEATQIAKLHLHFKSRKTFWKYLDVKSRAMLFQTAEKKPLLKNDQVKITNTDLTDNSINLPDFIPNPSPNLIIHEAGEDYSIMYINN